MDTMIMLNRLLLLALCAWLLPGAVRAEGSAMLTGVTRIVFVGDSLTDGSAWPDWVVETLGAHGYPGLRHFNAGISGNTSAQVKDRLQADVIALRPDLVVLCIGTNDTNTGVPLAAYRSNLEAIVRAVRESGARLLLLTPPALRDPVKNQCLYGCDAVLRELAGQYGATVGDTHAAFDQGLKAGQALLGPDGVHHQLDGWRMLARVTLDALGCSAPLVERTARYPGTLTDWWISPPVAWKAGTPYPAPAMAKTFSPRKAGWTHWDGGTLHELAWWQRCWIDRGCVLPLGSNPAPGSGALAMTTINTSRAKTVTLHVGGSPPVVVWLNGALVWDGAKLHGYHPDADRLRIPLRRGSNRLVVFSTWMFHVALGEI